MIIDKDFIIQVHHIGGSDDVGPVSTMTGLTNSVFWTFYDADKSMFNKATDMNYTLIDKCIGGIDGKTKFNIFVNPSASSVLLPAKSASRYMFNITNDGKLIAWGNHTKLDRTIEMDINRLDTLLDKKEINPIDILSVDAQGSEYDIFQGAGDYMKDILAVFSEVEFSQLYEGQKLYGDIDKLLREKGFRLCYLFNPQYFNYCLYEGCSRGQGFLIDHEALFLRNPETLYQRFHVGISKEEFEQLAMKCIKLAIIGLTYNQPDFAWDIIKTLEDNKIISINYLAEHSKHSYFKILKRLMEGTLELRFVKT